MREVHFVSDFKPLRNDLLICVMGQHEVAAELGMSQATVARLERSALRKLRALPEAKALLQFVRFAPREGRDAVSAEHR